MAIPARYRVLAGLVLVACLVLLGRWAMHQPNAPNAPPEIQRLDSQDSAPATAQPPANIPASASAKTPSRVATASNFGTLRGRVIDAVTRKPVHEFDVQFHGTHQTKVGEEAPGARHFQSDTGRFEWEYLPPGEWAVTASAAGYQRFELMGIRVPKGDATPEVLLPLRRGHTLRGRVYDEESGVGIDAASIGFREADTGRFDGNWRMRARFTSASDGTFVLDGLPPGRLTLDVHAPDHASRELDIVMGEQMSPLDVALSAGGTIAGHLTAADGVTPVKGFAGLFSLDQGFGGNSQTGEAGEFSFANLSPGRYQLTGQADSGSAAREIVLARNQRIEGIVLAVGGGRSIRGVVTGLRPEDLKRVSISLRRAGDMGVNPYGFVGVDTRGAFALKGVQPGRVEVVADVSMRRQLSRPVNVPADSDVTINFDFPSGARLSGRVTRGGKPLSNAEIEPRAAFKQDGYVYGTKTSNDGTYAFEDLANGVYVLYVDGYKSKSIEVSGDTVFDIDVPASQLSGRVLEEGGKVPIVGADVEAWALEPGSSRRLHDRSDHYGQFALAAPDPGEYLLAIYKPGYEMFRKRVAYESPVADMTVRLRQEEGVEIRVRGADSRRTIEHVYVVETIGGRNGSQLRVHLDDNGVGYVPSALAGSTLSFSSFGYAPSVIPDWNGERLELRLERAPQAD
jgi:hypothetical protein